MSRPQLALNLFWRTFFLLALLLVGSILAWLQTLRALEFEPRTLHTAQQIASMVNLSRAALVHADAIARVSLIKTMADQEGVRILPREPGDHFELLDSSDLGLRLTEALTERLGPGTVVARSVNGEEGLWVGFTINDDPNWLLMDRSRFSPAGGKTWLVWLATATILSLVGAAAIRAAFEAMFANGAVRAHPERLRKVESLGAALHNVLERVDLVTAEGTQHAWVVATNVYFKTAQGWRLVAHHASPGRSEVAEVSQPAQLLH